MEEEELAELRGIGRRPRGVEDLLDATSPKRLDALPEEALGAGEPLSSTHVLAGRPPKPLLQAFAYRHSSWVGPKGSDRRGDYRCRAVHGHDYTEAQLAPIRKEYGMAQHFLEWWHMVGILQRERILGREKAKKSYGQ